MSMAGYDGSITILDPCFFIRKLKNVKQHQFYLYVVEAYDMKVSKLQESYPVI
jgi:tRNA 2-selenouridine synthase SelU